jgi:hypothetical protein
LRRWPFACGCSRARHLDLIQKCSFTPN